jgi:hypothetical protein
MTDLSCGVCCVTRQPLSSLPLSMSTIEQEQHPPLPQLQQTTPRLTLEIILFECGLYYHILPYLSWSKVLALESMNSLFYHTIRSSEPVWREILFKFFQTKYYLRSIIKRFLTDGNRIDYRLDLIKMTIKELKSLAYSYGLNITTCFEKADLIAVIHKREIREKLPVECLAHYGLRIAWLDRKRNYLTEEDLCSYEWNIRVRADGPLKSLVSSDPWWTDTSDTQENENQMTETGVSHTGQRRQEEEGEGLVKQTTAIIKFYPNSEFQIIRNGPSFLESLMDGDPNERFTYALEKSGTILSLSIGVKEYIARHPHNWGFILQSQGTVWTNYPMPKRGKDILLEDENVSFLIMREIDYGPCV